MEQEQRNPNKYIKEKFDFGNIAVARFDTGNRPILWISYWGKDRRFERIKIVNGIGVFQADIGTYSSGELGAVKYNSLGPDLFFEDDSEVPEEERNSEVPKKVKIYTFESLNGFVPNILARTDKVEDLIRKVLSN